jgi:hypothetical protein
VKLDRFIVLSFVTICYLQAALEINTEGIENSWGDMYDMYVGSASISHQATIKKETSADLISDSAGSGFYQVLFCTSIDCVPLNSSRVNPGIFLKLRSLRI